MAKRLAGAIDITIETFPGMVVYPGECETAKEMHFAPAAGQPITCAHWSLTAHAGTHLDAPRHFDPQGKAISDYPPDFFEFRAAVLDATALRRQGRHADVKFLESKRALLDGCDAVLIKTHEGELWKAPAFDEEHTAIAHEAAAMLTRQGNIRLAGIDYFSVEPWGVEEFRTHLSFLLNGIFILEGIDLSRIPEGAYTLICLPAKWRDAEAAPTRALLIP
ncbi:MAG: cyclase family protein [Candidatus Sumerlaeota bacterium]